MFSVVLSLAGLRWGCVLGYVKYCGVTFLFVCFSAAFRLGLDYCVFASVDGGLDLQVVCFPGGFIFCGVCNCVIVFVCVLCL